MDADISGIRKVSVNLRSIIDGEMSEFDFPGEYQMRNGSHCVVYTDYTGNDITKVGIEASENTMLLHRVGFITADMLFDPEHRTSKPLCLAYKAAQLAAPDKADAFLTVLRHATVLEYRPTTHEDIN